jgi:hypothetical protein
LTKTRNSLKLMLLFLIGERNSSFLFDLHKDLRSCWFVGIVVCNNIWRTSLMFLLFLLSSKI